MGVAIRKASLLVRGRKRDSEEEGILKTVTLGGARQVVRITLIPVRNLGIGILILLTRCHDGLGQWSERVHRESETGQLGNPHSAH